MLKLMLIGSLVCFSAGSLAREAFIPEEETLVLPQESVSSRDGIRTKQEIITKIYQDKNAGSHSFKIAENSQLCGSFFNDTSYRPRDIWRCNEGQEEYSIGDGTYPSDYDADGNYIGGSTTGGATGGLIRK